MAQNNPSNPAAQWLESFNENAREAQSRLVSHATKAAQLAQTQMTRNLGLLKEIADNNTKTIQALSTAHSPQAAAQILSAGATTNANKVLAHVQESATEAQESLAELRDEAETILKKSSAAATDAWSAGVVHAQESAKHARAVSENVIQRASEVADQARSATEQAAHQAHETIQRTGQHVQRATAEAAERTTRAASATHHTTAHRAPAHKATAHKTTARKTSAAAKKSS